MSWKKNLIVPAATIAFSVGFVACGSGDRDKDKKPPGDNDASGEVSPESGGQSRTTMKVVTPVLSGVYKEYITEDKACKGKEYGSVLIRKTLSVNLVFCLGTLKSSDYNYQSVLVYGDGFDGTFDDGTMNVHVGIITDTVDGITDLSYIALIDTPTMIKAQCGSTYFSSKTVTIGGSSMTEKAYSNQTQAVVKNGICSDVYIASAKDLESVTVKKSSKNISMPLTLTKVYP